MVSINKIRPFSAGSLETENLIWSDYPISEDDGIKKNPYFQNIVNPRMIIERDGQLKYVQISIDDFETRKVPDWLKTELLKFSMKQPSTYTIKNNIESFNIRNEYKPCSSGCGSNNYLLFPIEEVKEQKKVEKNTKSKKSGKK